jgi:hypothetical protein
MAEEGVREREYGNSPVSSFSINFGNPCMTPRQDMYHCVRGLSGTAQLGHQRGYDY